MELKGERRTAGVSNSHLCPDPTAEHTSPGHHMETFCCSDASPQEKHPDLKGPCLWKLFLPWNKNIANFYPPIQTFFSSYLSSDFFCQNCEFISHSSAAFSYISKLISRNSDFFYRITNLHLTIWFILQFRCFFLKFASLYLTIQTFFSKIVSLYLIIETFMLRIASLRLTVQTFHRIQIYIYLTILTFFSELQACIFSLRLITCDCEKKVQKVNSFESQTAKTMLKANNKMHV